jgi:hypothetical protein
LRYFASRPPSSNNNVAKVSLDFSAAEIDAGKIPEESTITSQKYPCFQ